MTDECPSGAHLLHAHLARDSVKAAAERVAGSLAVDLDTPPNAAAETNFADHIDERIWSRTVLPAQDVRAN